MNRRQFIKGIGVLILAPNLAADILTKRSSSVMNPVLTEDELGGFYMPPDIEKSFRKLFTEQMAIQIDKEFVIGKEIK